ncbi:hypothetical protein [Sphingomonas sp. BK580]|uniref:hypothetical protein n=1 Tax=Sphingomonas sp. BK580 TaxID=2586972 RepID=UPI001607C232|nr:hypothetical protein [Sphingomonas sp. BK580]MBB3693598.1 hypothetical protein [Sphingomonas sp. BK580]
MKRTGEQAWRRIALAALGMIILSLLAWSVSEGAIHLGGRRVARDDEPLVFWLEAGGIGAIGVGILYVALFCGWLVAPAASKRR